MTHTLGAIYAPSLRMKGGSVHTEPREAGMAPQYVVGRAGKEIRELFLRGPFISKVSRARETESLGEDVVRRWIDAKKVCFCLVALLLLFFQPRQTWVVESLSPDGGVARFFFFWSSSSEWR